MAAATRPNAEKQSMQLTTVDAVIDYLSGTPFKSTKADILFGGSANFIYRAYLVTPYRGQFETVVVKHDQSYIKDMPSFVFSLERQVYEVEALRRIRSWVDSKTAGDSIVTVPEIYSFDAENSTIIMEDCGTNILTLKESLRSAPLAPIASALAPSIGSSLGNFLAQMHHWSRSNPDGLLDYFRANELAKTISGWATYGRLMETLDGTAKLPNLQEPKLQVADGDLEVVSEIANVMQSRIKNANDMFVMGDFFPGNIMVALKPAEAGVTPEIKHIYIFDWELAKTGIPGVELGQFCGEMIQLQRFAQDLQQVAPVAQLLHQFLSSYASALRAAGDPVANDAQFIRDTIVHCGNHLVVWTPRTETWAEKEICRKVVSEGVELMVNAYKGEEEFLKQTFAKCML